jgi:hypothetical protein
MGINEKEWQNLLALEYILTHGYSDNVNADTKRYIKLSARKWNYGFSFNIDLYYKNMVSNFVNK